MDTLVAVVLGRGIIVPVDSANLVHFQIITWSIQQSLHVRISYVILVRVMLQLAGMLLKKHIVRHVPTGYASPLGNTVCENVNECLKNPCGTHGTCTDLPGTYSCTCDDDYGGDQCYSINHCDDTPCNNGECHNGASKATCNCIDGWEGDTCISSIDDCFTNACSGHGECIDKHMEYECSCDSGFDGNLCQNDICALITDPTEYINNQCCSC